MKHGMPDNLDLRTAPDAGLWTRWSKPLMGVAAIGAIGCVIGLVAGGRQFWFSYLVGYLFSLTLVLGMLFFVMLQHVTDAGWSVVVRRSAEQCLAAIPLLAALFIPVLIGTFNGSLFEWTHAEGGEILEAKRPFLNLPFFCARLVIYFGVWFLLERILRGKSLRQDQGGEAKLSLSMRRWSAPGFLLYAVTFTFAMIDWIMTLEYEWFSTIFGVYVWSGSAVAAIALLTLMVLGLRGGALRGLVSSDHLHDLGKLLFAFAVFWAYIAFSQYFLTWYSNIPEETAYYIHRWHGGWRVVGVVLPAIHFGVPFVALMSAIPKRRPRVLAVMSLLLLAVHYLDLYWMIMPVLHADGPALKWLWLDLSAAAFVAGSSALVVLRTLARHPAYPICDPRLPEAIAGEHALAGEHS